MSAKKPDPKSKSAPGLVSIRLQVTPEEREELRVVASQAGKSMAIWCRDLVRSELAKARERKPKG